jgi:hypothetical protein
MSRTMKPNYVSLWFVAICIVLTVLFSACSGGSGQQSTNTGDTGDTNTMPPGTGGVSFRLVWQQSPLSGAKALFAPPFNVCVDYAIGTITATVFDGSLDIASGSWPCSLHEGQLLGVPAGTNLTVRIDGMSTGPTTTTWSGVSVPITVVAGKVTSAGAIIMGYVGGDTAPPTVTSIAPHSGAGTTNVPVTDRITVAFNEPMAISTIRSSNITLKLTDNSPISGTVAYFGASNTAAFIPSVPLANDTEYVVNVISCITGSCIKDIAGNLLASNYSYTFTTESALGTVPNAPSGVTAAASNGQVTLDWIASNGAATYNIYYLSSAGVTTTSGTLIADARPPFVHLGLTNSQAYYYIVTAVNGSGESLASAEVSTTPVFPGGTPLPPASVTATAGSGSNSITWSAVAGATSYNLYWSTTPIAPDKNSADNVVRGITSPSYTHIITDELTHCYMVTAMNATGESAGSMQACVLGSGAIQFIW